MLNEEFVNQLSLFSGGSDEADEEGGLVKLSAGVLLTYAQVRG